MENAETKSDQEILNEFATKYLKDTKKYEACENSLVGNFNEKNEYIILDIIIKELINLQKLIEFKDDSQYKATAVVNKVKLNFVVTIEDLPENKKMATLKLIEDFVVAKIYKSSITTQLAKLTENNTDNFLFNVKKAFHLVSKEELNGKIDLKNYVGPPIELFTELKKKQDIWSIFCKENEDIENKYLSAIFKFLKTAKNGNEVVKKFVNLVRTNQLDKNAQNKFLVFRQILDKIVDEEILQSKFDIEENKKIKEARTTLLEDLKTIEKHLKQEKEGILGTNNLKPKSPSKPSVKAKTESPGGSGGGSKGGGGGGSKGGGDSKKEDTKAKGNTSSLFGEKFFEGLREKKPVPEKAEGEKPQEKTPQKKVKPQAKQKQEEKVNQKDFYKSIESQFVEMRELLGDIRKEEVLKAETNTNTTVVKTEIIELKEETPEANSTLVVERIDEKNQGAPKRFEELKKLFENEMDKTQ
ncbi:MAG: hypothetical protein PHQ62_02485 [Clostridia bacterium]|nr:hypothetical protein [Clostridia bacterium]